MVNSTRSVARRPDAEIVAAVKPALRPRSARPGLARRGAIAALVRREAPRRLLWLPVALAGGIGAYFSLTVEPPAAAGPAATAAAIVLVPLTRRSVFLRWIALLLVAAGLGFSAAQLRTRSVATVMLDREVWATVEGRLKGIEQRPAGWRLTLTAAVLVDVAPDVVTPSAARIAIGGRRHDDLLRSLRIGDVVRVRARLRPPSPPVAPGAYDFQRDAYFRGIGAVGFAVGAVERVAPAPAAWSAGPGQLVEGVRLAAAQRVRTGLPGVTGAVAAAMLVGDRAGIDEPTAETFRETGLAHLLAISGLHMGLVAGTVYAALRVVLAAWPQVALRRPVKKWAAGVALAAAALYLLLAGAPVPTQRAFLMTGLILVAVVLDREPISLHLVAWAAAAVLLLAPESLTGPSFQLSFAAVTALVALWELLVRRRRVGGVGRRGPLRTAARYLAGVAATSAVASLVTAPVVAHHFQQVPVLGAVVNLVAVPITAFVTMPAGVAALLVMPVGWEAWPLRLMGWGIEATLWAAERASAAPLTAVGVSAIGTIPLLSLAVGSLWLALWRTGLRWLGLTAIAGGIAAAWFEPQPDALFAADGTLAAVRVPGHGWAVSQQTGSGFVREAWARRRGGTAATGFEPAEATGLPAGGSDGFACDGFGCVLRIAGRTLAMPTSPEAAAEDCRRAELVVTAVRLRRGCPGGAVVIDRDDLRRDGAVAVWATRNGLRTTSVGELRGSRPWTLDVARKARK